MPIDSWPRSLLLAALDDAAWHCVESRAFALPAEGLARRSPAAPGLQMYWVERSPCVLMLAGEREILVPAGALVALARGQAHRLAPAGAQGLAAVLACAWPTSAWCASLLLRADAALVCPTEPASLGEAMSTLRAPWRQAPDAHAAAASAPRALVEPAAREMAQRLIGRLQASPAESPLAALLAAERLGPALAPLLTAQGPLPSIDALAQDCHLSRAAFTRRFAEAAGMSYLDFMTHWRMNVAAHRLALGGASVAEMAERFGYESEPSFRKAFRRATGVTPGAARAAGELDALFGAMRDGPQDDASAASTSTASAVSTAHPLPTPALAQPARLAVSTHADPPDLASLLARVITGL